MRCDGGDAFVNVNVIKFLRKEENFETELWFESVPELDDDDAIDWCGKESRSHQQVENSWWDLLFYARLQPSKSRGIL